MEYKSSRQLKLIVSYKFTLNSFIIRVIYGEIKNNLIILCSLKYRMKNVVMQKYNTITIARNFVNKKRCNNKFNKRL